ncbi:MAG TPA: hypothetical protein VFR33_15160 [Candidatus Dormibacteraeota bacterium]|nr:hypothetical protein [Candidatus Dormibacteraeota bacterium]
MRATARALSDARWTIVAFAIAGFAITFLQSVAFFRLAGHTFAERAAFGYSLLLDATADAPLFPPPVHPETVAGYLELRAFAPLAILFAAWALVSAERSATALIIPRSVAFAIGSLVAAAAACAGVMAGVASGGETVDAAGLVQAGLLLVALASACYAICMCAGPMAAPLLLTLFFLNSLSRVFVQLDAVRWLSPFRYYDLSTPLPRDGHFDAGGFAVLVAIAGVGTGVAYAISSRSRREAALIRRSDYEPSHASLLTVPVLRDLYPHRMVIAAWCIAFALLGIALAAATRTTMQDLLALPRGLPGLPQYIFVFGAQVLGQTWFDVMLLMFVALTFTFVMRWADDDSSGRLEATLSAPYSRSAVVLERIAALAVAVAILAAVSGIAVALTARASDLAVDAARIAGACLVLALFGVLLGAVGVLFASAAPRAAGAFFGAIVFAAYLADQIGGALRLPGWLQTVSPFRLAGAPLANGLDPRTLAVLIALIVAGIGSSILVMQQRDVGR